LADEWDRKASNLRVSYDITARKNRGQVHGIISTLTNNATQLRTLLAASEGGEGL
jgi:hypothetical protein